MATIRQPIQMWWKPRNGRGKSFHNLENQTLNAMLGCISLGTDVIFWKFKDAGFVFPQPQRDLNPVVAYSAISLVLHMAFTSLSNEGLDREAFSAKVRCPPSFPGSRKRIALVHHHTLDLLYS